MAKTQLEIVGVEKAHSILTDSVCIVHLLLNVPVRHNKNNLILQPVKLGGQDDAHTSKWSQNIYYFICLPFLLVLHMAQKIPGLTKYTFQQGSLPYHKEIFVQGG